MTSPTDEPEQPGLYDDIDFAVLLQIAGRMIGQYVDAIGKELGYSAGHLSVLGMVHRKPGLVQNVYGTILAINDATLARYVDKLVRCKLVLRQRSKEDRRTVRLQMTPAGIVLIEDVKSRLSEVREQMRSRLSEAQIAQLEQNLVAFLGAEGPDPQLPVDKGK